MICVTTSEPSILILTSEGKLAKTIHLPVAASSVAWLPDGSGLFFVAFEKLVYAAPTQIWFQPYPEGGPFRITNDLTSYSSLSVTADGKSLLTVQRRWEATIYVGDSPSTLNGKIDWKLVPISTERNTGYLLSWMASGKLLQLSGDGRYYITNVDGSGYVPLLTNDDVAWQPATCGMGDLGVFSKASDMFTSNLFRLDIATRELKQLTFGKDWLAGASCTPDGKWVVYTRFDNNLWHICKISTEGGSASELAHFANPQYSEVVSPDGRFLAYISTGGQGMNAKNKLVVKPLEGTAPTREIEVPFDAQRPGWTPDGRALTFLRTVGTARHLYMQSLTTPCSLSPPSARLLVFNRTGICYRQAQSWQRKTKKKPQAEPREIHPNLKSFIDRVIVPAVWIDAEAGERVA